MKLGVQTYGCMRVFRADPEKFCARLAAAGYTQLEPCISMNKTAQELEAAGMNPVWLPEEVPSFAAMMAEHGLELSSCHVFCDLRADAERVAELAEACHIPQIVVSFPSGDLKALWSPFAEDCLYLAEKLKQVGAELWIHNHCAEIRTKVNGKTALELVLERCAGAVGAQIDVGWVLYGGEEPVAYLERVLPYVRSMHYKDMKPGYAQMAMNDEIHAVLGRGALDWRAVQAYVQAHGIPELVDQDVSAGDFLADLEESAARLLGK